MISLNPERGEEAEAGQCVIQVNSTGVDNNHACVTVAVACNVWLRLNLSQNS